MPLPRSVDELTGGREVKLELIQLAKNRQGLALSSSPIRTLTVGSGISPNQPKKVSRTLDSGRGLYRRLRFSLTPKNVVAFLSLQKTEGGALLFPPLPAIS